MKSERVCAICAFRVNIVGGNAIGLKRRSNMCDRPNGTTIDDSIQLIEKRVREIVREEIAAVVSQVTASVSEVLMSTFRVAANTRHIPGRAR